MRAHLENDHEGEVLVFEDPVTHTRWTIGRDGGDVWFISEYGDLVWMRKSDAASVGDWLRRQNADVDWRIGVDPEHTSIPIKEPEPSADD